MIYMLDTNICIYLINKKPLNYVGKLEELEQQGLLAISSIVLSELQYGVFNSYHQSQNQINLDSFISRLEVIDYSAKCAYYYGKLRAELKTKGIIIGNNDLLIASHALAEQATLITNNIKEFTRIRELKLESWE